MRKFLIGISAIVISFTMCTSLVSAEEIASSDDIQIEENLDDNEIVYDGQSYTVTYDKQGYTGATVQDQVIVSGSEFKVSVYKCIREGFVQSGWTDGENDYDFGEIYIMPNHDVTFTPVWKEIFNVHYEYSEYLDENPVLNEIDDSAVAEDDTFTLSSIVIYHEGYYQYGWSDGENTYYRGEEYTMPNHDVILTPAFFKYYNVTYSTGDVSGTVGNTTYTFEHYETDVFDLATSDRLSRTGYNLSGWHCVEDDTDYKTVAQFTMPSHDVTMEAIWSPKTITITYKSDDETSTEKVTYDSQYTFPECPFTKDGYTFIGWQVKDDIYQTGDIITMNLATSKLSMTALWQENSTYEDIKGDLNQDSKITYADTLLLKKYLLGVVDYDKTSSIINKADINSDGSINTLDLIQLKSIVLE